MKTQNVLLALIASTATLALAACGDAGPRVIPGNTGGTSAGGGGGGGAPAAMGTPLVIEGTTGDYVSGESNTFGIQGSFYKYSDCDTDGDGVDNPESFMAAIACTEGWTLDALTTPGTVCISGTVGVREDTTNYTDWGAGMGFNLNEAMPAVEGENGTPNPWNATAVGVTGISFTITGTALPANAVVEFPNPGIVEGEEHNKRIVMGANTVSFSGVDLAQPSWATMKVPFDATMIIAMKWKVESATAANPVAFCVSNVTPIQ